MSPTGNVPLHRPACRWTAIFFILREFYTVAGLSLLFKTDSLLSGWPKIDLEWKKGMSNL